VERSVFFGWTGMASKRKPAAVVGREGLNSKNREQEAIEIDSTFGRLLGILDGQKVSCPECEWIGEGHN
jgi:peroxin-1